MAAVLVFQLTGGVDNITASTSLGGIMSSESIASEPMNNLYDNVTAEERVSGIAKEYRALDVYNSGDAQAESIELFMSTVTHSTGTLLQIGHDATNNPHASDWEGELIINDITDPASPVIVFDERTTDDRLTLPNIPVGQACRIWFNRIVTADVENTFNDYGTIAIEYA